MASHEREEDRDIELVVTFPTYGTPQQRYNTAAEIKRILEVKLQKKVEVYFKHGNEYQEVDRQDRNATVE